MRFGEFRDPEIMAEEFFEVMLNPSINESIDEPKVKDILKGLAADLKFNTRLVFTFGTGITAMYGVIDNLIRNGNLKMDMTPENIILLSLTAISITYLEESNNKVGDDRTVCTDCEGMGFKNHDEDDEDEDDEECPTCKGTGYLNSLVTKKDAQTMLEELKMRGIGNGIVKKYVEVTKAIGKFFQIVFRGTPYVIKSFVDMFAYSALLLPAMNAVAAAVGKYDLTVDTAVANLISLGVGVGTFLGKQVFSYLVDRLKSSLHIKLPSATRNMQVMPHDIVDGETDAKRLKNNKLIKDNIKHI